MDITIIYHYIIKYILPILLLSGLIYACIPFRTKKVTVPIINNTSIPTSEMWIEDKVEMHAGTIVSGSFNLFKPSSSRPRFNNYKKTNSKINLIKKSFTTTPISLWAFPWSMPQPYTKGTVLIYRDNQPLSVIFYDKKGYFNFDIGESHGIKLKEGIILQEYPIQIDYNKIPISKIIKESIVEYIYVSVFIGDISFSSQLDSKISLKDSIQRLSIFVTLPKMYENKLDDIRFSLSIGSSSNSFDGVDMLKDAHGGNLLLRYDKNTSSLIFDESVQGYKELRKLNNYYLRKQGASLIKDFKYELVKELWEKYNFDPDPKELDWLLYISSYFSMSDYISGKMGKFSDFKLNHYLIIKFLLEKGANPNVRYPLTNPILFHVIGANNLEAVKCMVEHGADLKAQNVFFGNFGKLPSEWAAWYKVKEIETYLKQKEIDSK